MFAFLRSLVWIFLVIIIAAGFFFWHYRVTMTQHLLTTLLHNKVTLSDVDLSISLSRINAKNIAIQNPRPAPVKNAVFAKAFDIKLQFFSIFKKKVIIEEINLDRVQFFIDMYNPLGTSNNWKVITQKMKEGAILPDGEPNPHRKHVIIQKLVARDIVFSYRNSALSTQVKSLNPEKVVILNNIGSGHPVSMDHVVSLFARIMLSHFVSLSGYTNLLKGMPILPLHLTENLFIHHQGKDTHYNDFTKTPEEKPQKATSFIKKLFTIPRRRSALRL